MERREFLIGLGCAVLVPAAFGVGQGCSKSSTSPTPADSFEVVSSSSASPGGVLHSHTLRVLLADLASPPAAGVTYTTGLSGGHTHLLTISRGDLADIQAGLTRAESTTVVLGHEHIFSIRKP